MNPYELAGHWRGVFIYGGTYKEMQGTKESFSMVIEEVNDGTFKGRCIDLDSPTGKYIKTSINGFIEDDFISFTKEYPHRYEMNAKGEYKIQSNKKGHVVKYEGNFNLSTNSFIGSWEIIQIFRVLWIRLYEQRTDGEWSMQKEIR